MFAPGAATKCEIAPLSDQLLQTCSVPPEMFCGEVVAMVCEDPTTQLKVCGAVEVMPSTVMESPAGMVVTTTVSRMLMVVLTVWLSTMAVMLKSLPALPFAA